MNDDNLRSHLQKLRVPAANEVARERARHRALLALQHPVSAQVGSAIETVFNLRWVFAVVILGCIVIIGWVAQRPPRENLAEDRELVRQVEKLFPGQVDSIVEQNGKIDLAIAQSRVVGTDQPIVIVFRHGDQSIRVLSYSGHHVCLSLGSQRDCLEILATPNGGVILEGENKAWLASPDTELAGYHVTARSLSTL